MLFQLQFLDILTIYLFLMTSGLYDIISQFMALVFRGKEVTSLFDNFDLAEEKNLDKITLKIQ